MEWIIGTVLVLWIIGKLSSGKSKSNPAKARGAGNTEPQIGFRVKTVEQTDWQSGGPKSRKEFDIAQWESELRSVWSGDPLAVTFTYHGHRRQVQVREVLHHPSGHVFMLGHCSYRDEYRYFDLAKLDTMILMKSKRYDAYDWLIRVLGEDAVMGMELVL
ncbi:hypothetical protein CFI10_11330 [Marinobacterium iners]|uniref:hypothetical protein n=1 Tax=Marinobacterium iners TaxID=48076 RepID=UPI001A8D5131|nr:hypothetical protein [Marinobacterium iners]QSR35580.1 hypothetical protein CFI10_11330 [Marinobacterium iners]